MEDGGNQERSEPAHARHGGGRAPVNPLNRARSFPERSLSGRDLEVAEQEPTVVALRLVGEAPGRGVRVFIVGAGAAAHLAGVVAAHTTMPVIGVPIDSSALKGLDALLSTVQMPPGVPVATVSIGKPGATNAGVLAAQILALSDTTIAGRLVDYKKKLAEKVEQAAARLQG